MGGGGSGEIEAVFASSDANTVYFGLGGSNGDDHSGVCDYTTMGDGGFCFKEGGVGSGGHAGADALGEAS